MLNSSLQVCYDSFSLLSRVLVWSITACTCCILKFLLLLRDIASYMLLFLLAAGFLSNYDKECFTDNVKQRCTRDHRQLSAVAATSPIHGHQAVPARPGGTSGRAGPERCRASTGRRACRAVPAPCSCLAFGPRHGPWAVWPCRAARWARPFSPCRAGLQPDRQKNTSKKSPSAETLHFQISTNKRLHFHSHSHTVINIHIHTQL